MKARWRKRSRRRRAGTFCLSRRSNPCRREKIGGSSSTREFQPANGKRALPAAREVLLGTVQKFAVKDTKAEGNRIDGRRLIVEFNKAFAEDISAETVGRWIKVEPAPANLKTVIGDDLVTFRGDFSLGTRYRVSVAAGLPAREPTATSAPFKQEVAFEKYDSRLYFQDITAHQYVGGTRQLRLVSVNVPRVRVSAKLFTGTQVPAAVKAFDAYEERPEDLPDEMYTRVNVESLGGNVIWEREITPGGAVDSQDIVPLNWDEMVGKNHGGAVVFTAESIDPVGPNGKRVGTQTLMQLTDLGAVWKRDRDGYFAACVLARHRQRNFRCAGAADRQRPEAARAKAQPIRMAMRA